MAIQVSYPGVYIEEFAPGAPIQGVGTNVAAFIGTASNGPIGKPTLIQSWDAFEDEFGGFISQRPTSYLAPAVYGFFLNGGTTCYVLRHGTGVMASANLTSRETPADAVLVVQARSEGPEGNSIEVVVQDANRLARLLDLADSLASDLSLAHSSTSITAVSDDRRVVTVADNSGFVAGDGVLLTDTGGSEATGAIESTGVDSTSGNQLITLVTPIPGADDFTGGTIRIADLVVGQKRLRLDLQGLDRLRLNQALPKGATVEVSGIDTTGNTQTEIHTVDSSGRDAITLSEGLAHVYDMSDDTNLPRVRSLEFTIVVTDLVTGRSETFLEVAMDAHHPNYWEASVESEFITLVEPDALPAPIPEDPRPVFQTYTLATGAQDDRAAAWAEIDSNPHACLDLLKTYDDIALVSIPGAFSAPVQQAIIEHCESMYDRFAILDSILGVGPGNGIRDQLLDVQNQNGFAALYYPWVLARNPLTKRDELWPPSGHIAGVYVRTDATRGVHKAPANTNIRGVLGVERMLTDAEQGPLNLLGINVLRVFGGRGQPMVWGARTVATDRNWQYVNIRRLFLFLEESIAEGIRWAVFEPNNLQLWQKLKQSITEFLTRVWRDGALFGATADEAFYVRIDEALNPESTRKLGRLNIEVGVRPAYPAEFIIVRIGIWSGGAEVSES